MRAKPMVNLERKTKVVEFYPDADNTVEGLIAEIQTFQQSTPEVKQWYTEMEWTGYEDCSFRLFGKRPETDAEYEQRISDEKEELRDWQKDKEWEDAEKEAIKQAKIKQLEAELKKLKS